MSIRHRIWALPGIATILFGIGLAVTVLLTTGAITSIGATAQIDYPLLDQGKALGLEIQGVIDGLKDAVTEGDKKRIGQVSAQAVRVRERIKSLAAIPGQAARAQRLGQEFEDYYAPAARIARIMLEMEQGDPAADIGTMQQALRVLESDLAATQAMAHQQFSNGIAHSADQVQAVLHTSILVAVLVIVSLAGVSFFVVRSIWRQLGGEPEYACAIAHAVAAGDLSMPIAVRSSDERSILAELRAMQVKLGGMVAGINRASGTIKAASDDIASGNANLASRTEFQASSLEQTASAMDALTDTVRKNALFAEHANQLAETASDMAREGSTVVGRVITTMADIQASAKRIVDIISVIDGIAFQTNILALNAAVEAARAGEHGRGFAVVATEVRNLAQRAATAAREIRELILASVEKVDTGTGLADMAGSTMDKMLTAVQHVASIMGDIAVASREQSSSIAEVTQTVAQMDKMTQQNANLVEEATVHAESLQGQAALLNTSLAAFRLADRGQPADGRGQPPSAPSLRLASPQPRPRLE